MGIIFIKIIFIIGLPILTIGWGKLFIIGKRILLPFNFQDLKKDLRVTILAFILCICGLCCMIVTSLGTILLIYTFFL